MAIDLCSESPSLTTSPRISFSHAIHNPDDQIQIPSSHEIHQPRSDPSPILDSDSEFNFFVVPNSMATEASSADELFSGGLIRPQQVQPRFVRSSSSSSSSTRKLATLSNPQPIIPSLTLPPPIPTTGHSENEAKNPQPKSSIWGIKRSSTSLVRCDDTSSSHKKSPFWSLQLLSRSNSTGSVPKEDNSHRQNPNAQTKFFRSSSSSSSSKKPSVKKINYGGGGAYGGIGVRISPVLNVPPPFIYRGTYTNLFGFGSLFRNAKDKKNKK